MDNSFKNIDTNEVVRIITETENHFVLDSGQKWDKKLFVQKYVANMKPAPTYSENVIQEQVQQTLPSDTVDVNSFFSTTTPIEGLEEGIKNIDKVDSSKVLEITKNEGWVPKVKDLEKEDHQTQINENIMTPVSLEQEKEMLRQRHNKQEEFKRKLNENGLTVAQETTRQQQIELTGEDPYKTKITKYRSNQGLNPNAIDNPQMIDSPTDEKITNYQSQDYEVIKIFKKFKKTHNFKTKISIAEKIADPEFIKMMIENLDGDIIQYYTDVIYEKIISDTDKLKENIYNQIYKHIFGINKPVIETEIEEIKDTKEKENKTIKKIVLIPGGKTSAGKQKYKFINNKGKVVNMLIESAQKKQYKPAVNKDLK